VATPATATDQHRPGYGALLRTPGAWTFVLPGFLARMPVAMLAIGIVLLVEHTTGSYGLAGAVTATCGVAIALLAPQSGRLADRFGQRAVLVPGVFLHAAAVGALILLALRDAPLWALFAVAVPVGASAPQISPMVRARWSARLDGSPLLTTAAAFESVTDEFTFVVGPVLATALCTSVHPAAGLAAEAALMLGGGLLFAARRGTQPVLPERGGAAGAGDGRTGGDQRGGQDGQAGQGGRGSALGFPGVRVLVAVLLGIGTVFGGMQVSVAAFTESAGRPEINGALYGVFAAGNTLAAFAMGTVRWRRAPRARLLLAYPVLVAAALTLAATAQLAPWLPLLGGAVALGQATGSLAAGQLTDGLGASGGFLAPLAGTGLALTALLVFRGRLASGPDGRVTARAVGHRAPAAVD